MAKLIITDHEEEDHVQEYEVADFAAATERLTEELDGDDPMFITQVLAAWNATHGNVHRHPNGPGASCSFRYETARLGP